MIHVARSASGAYADSPTPLRECHGVETHVADGQVKPHEFEALKHRFTSGEFPVLCLSRIGTEGHNLQNASIMVHWTSRGCRRNSSILSLRSLSRPCLIVRWFPVLRFSKRPGVAGN